MTILYEKIGRRYYPYSTDEWYKDVRASAPDQSRPGHILVTITDNCTHFLHKVDPARASVLAALKECREAIGNAMHKAAEFKPRTTLLSDRHAKAYARYLAAIPREEREGLWAGSIQDGLDAAIKVLEARL